ncbi:MAG: hypothetical protein LBE12_04345, partial [Planctomycetaceae bacterium]|nr:hypothetical protein [Planctomycetaceae bacterium]
MKKNTQHQGRVDLKAIKNSEQLINGLFKKFLHAISPKMSRRCLGTATVLAVISVNVGGGGGLGSLNKVYAADIGLTDSGEIITLYDVTNGPSVGVFIDSNNHEYKVGSTTGSYTSGDTFKLTNGDITLSANDKTNLGGIYTNDRTLNFDFGTKTVSVTNTKTDAVLTWGFGYASNSSFSGTLSATSSSSISVSSSSGQAFGLVFKSAMTQSAGFAELSNAKIDLSGTTIKVENSDNSGNNGEAYGFAAGNLTGNTTIKLGDIESVLAGQGNKIRGFVAGNVLESSSIELKNVTAQSNTDGKSKDVIAVELKDIQGKVTQTGTITAYGQGSAATDSAIGFSAQTIMPFTSQVTLNAVNVTEIDYGNAVGVSIVRNEGIFAVDAITVTAANNATGFKVSNSNVNNLTLQSIDATATLGNAIGLSLGDFNANTLGSAAAGTIILGGDITATSDNGGSAIGIYAGQLAGIDVSNKIFATTAATDDTTKAAYGIW